MSRNPIAKDVRTAKYAMRVVPSKKAKALARQRNPKHKKDLTCIKYES